MISAQVMTPAGEIMTPQDDHFSALSVTLCAKSNENAAPEANEVVPKSGSGKHSLRTWRGKKTCCKEGIRSREESPDASDVCQGSPARHFQADVLQKFAVKEEMCAKYYEKCCEDKQT